MKITKSIFLFLLLLFPVLIYLFLQGFGNNKFEIPLYYEFGIENPLVGCDEVTLGQTYRVDMEVFNSLFPLYSYSNAPMVYYVGDQSHSELGNNLLTFLEKYKHDKRASLSLISIDGEDQFEFSYENYHSYQGSSSSVLRLARCLFQIDVVYDSSSNRLSASTLILVDGQRRIRGYYDPSELKEMDRLNTELYILLNE